MSIAETFLPIWNTEAGLWAERMAHASLDGGVFIGVVWAICRLAPRLPAALRSWLWWLACLKLVLSLCGIAPLPLALLPAAPAQHLMQAAPQIVTGVILLTPATSGKIIGANSSQFTDDAAPPLPQTSPVVHFSWPLLLETLWLGGVLFSMARHLRLGLRMRRLVRDSRPASLPSEFSESFASLLGQSRIPCIMVSDQILTPCVTGLLRPVILLPTNLAERLSPDEIRLALAHEMAHIRRHDLALAILPSLTQSLFFFHPLVWIALREWAAAREEASDALALTATGALPTRFGHLLLKMAGGSSQAPALGLSAGYRTLQRRLITLTTPSHHTRKSRWLLLAALLGLVPWRLTAAVHSAQHGPSSQFTLRYTIADLGNVTEVSGLNSAGQAAMTLRDGNEAQGAAGTADALTPVGALPKHHFSIAYDINSLGDIAAASYNIPGHGRAFLWDGRRHRLGSLPDFPYSEARAVNDQGQVVGNAETGQHDRAQALIARAFLWQSGEMTDLGTLGGLYSSAYGINNQGQIVGKADTATFGETHAFLWQNGQMSDLGTLGGANSLACRINDLGTVVGCSEIGPGETRHAFAEQNGLMRDLGALPGLPDSVACGVNGSGVIVGYAEPSPDAPSKRAVLWNNGHALDLNMLLPAHSGWILCEARAVNDKGQIAGNGTLNGQPRAFILTPR